MLKIGLTGNIASGKSEVEKILSSLGYDVVDLDKIVHLFFKENEFVKNAILKEFKTLNKADIAKVVFRDEKEKAKLENIIHPELKKYILNFFKENQNKKIIFVSGALLFEAKFDILFDKTIYVNAIKEIRLNRLMKRNALNEYEANLRINSQQDNIDKADYVIENNSTIEDLKEKVVILLKELGII